MHRAAAEGSEEEINTALGSSSGRGELEAPDRESKATPLHWAAAAANEPAIESLLAKGCRANVKDRHGRTPLAMAAAKGYKGRGAAECLLRWGAEADNGALIAAVVVGDAILTSKLLAERQEKEGEGREQVPLQVLERGCAHNSGRALKVLLQFCRPEQVSASDCERLLRMCTGEASREAVRSFADMEKEAEEGEMSERECQEDVGEECIDAQEPVAQGEEEWERDGSMEAKAMVDEGRDEIARMRKLKEGRHSFHRDFLRRYALDDARGLFAPAEEVD